MDTFIPFKEAFEHSWAIRETEAFGCCLTDPPWLVYYLVYSRREEKREDGDSVSPLEAPWQLHLGGQKGGTPH